MRMLLKDLYIDNFKGIHSLHIDFNMQNANIFGDNATGKTTVYDALTWLLFSKDSQGRNENSFGIKPLSDDGQIKNHAAITSVSAELMIDEKMVVLTKTYKEIWSRKRGVLNEVFDGNTSEYFIDGLPLKKSEYDGKIAEIIKEDVFKAITDIKYFCNIAWKDRRQTLFEIAQIATDEELMQSDAQFAQLLDSKGNKTFDDYKKIVEAERKSLSSTRCDIPTRIDECKKTCDAIKNIDFDTAEAKKNNLTVELDTLTNKLLSLQNNSLISEKKNELQTISNEIRSVQLENDVFKNQQRQADASGKIKSEIDMLKSKISRTEFDKQSITIRVTALRTQLDEFRKNWASENDKVFSGQAICPTCNREFEKEKIEAIHNAFEVEKAAKLTSILNTAELLKKSIAENEKEVEQIDSQIKLLNEQLAEKTKELASLAVVEIKDIDGFADKITTLELKKTEITQALKSITDSQITVENELKANIQNIKIQLTETNALLNKREMLSMTEARIEELQQQALKIATQIEKYDQILYLCEQFIRFKTSKIEESVNSKFAFVKFKLFDELVNGGIAECCEATYQGIPYASVNNGAKINIGLDIINTLSSFYNAYTPLFVDNAESVTQIYQTSAQLICLFVSSQDKKLRIEV